VSPAAGKVAKKSAGKRTEKPRAASTLATTLFPWESTYRAACELASSESRFFFSTRNLYYALIQCGAPMARISEVSFGKQLSAFERLAGKHPFRIDPKHLKPVPKVFPEPDLFDYAVRRILVVDRLEILLILAMNGFFQKIEVGLLTLDAYPGHVLQAVKQQQKKKIPTTLLVLDQSFGNSERKRLEQLQGQLSGKCATWKALALKPTRMRPSSNEPLEALPPVQMMQQIYKRIARGHVDAGFG
jgi:hypothetical protein